MKLLKFFENIYITYSINTLMAKIINSRNNEEARVKDGENIRPACEKLGVPFSCKNGICGSCMIDIKKGSENLSELTEQEQDLGRDKENRLACQCKIKKGEVNIEF
jgi:ferredoxin